MAQIGRLRAGAWALFVIDTPQDSVRTERLLRELKHTTLVTYPKKTRTLERQHEAQSGLSGSLNRRQSTLDSVLPGRPYVGRSRV